MGKLSGAKAILRDYRTKLEQFRQQNGQLCSLPPVSFFLFGMGSRRKLVYINGVIKDSLTGEILYQWQIDEEIILPAEYSVFLSTTSGQLIQIIENETGIWLGEDDAWQPLSQSHLHLPTFEDSPYADILRVLHQEILVNIHNGLPLPNYFVYQKPWYRDGAMMAMVLHKTGNLDLIRDWIMSLDTPYDRNNGGETEADNLGEALYLLSLVTDASHPLVEMIQKEFPKFQVGNYLEGRSDFTLHPVYQTRWACFGLSALLINHAYHTPLLPDSYGPLVWWAERQQQVDGPRFRGFDYPYLNWAEAHYYHEHNGPTSDRDYPLSWEANASQANYPALASLSELYTQQRICAPHTWHAAEMFLYLLEAQRGQL